MKMSAVAVLLAGVAFGVVDAAAQEDDAILQQSAVDVHRPLFAAALFDHVGNQWHRTHLKFV
jgi:hypothetical protein